jgi:hypothetical protein
VRALDLLDHDFDLPGELSGIERGVADRVGEDVEPFGEVGGGEHEVVDGLVEARPGVDLAAQGLDLAGHLAHRPARRALEEHVLVQVGEARLVAGLVGAARRDPDLHAATGAERWRSKITVRPLAS